MILHCIAWYCMVLHGIARYWIALHGIAWYCMIFHGIFFFHIFLAWNPSCCHKGCGFLAAAWLAQTETSTSLQSASILLLATNAGRWVSMLDHHWCLVWFGLALLDRHLWPPALQFTQKGHFSGQPIHPATSYISELKNWVRNSNDWCKQRKRGWGRFHRPKPIAGLHS